MNKKIIELSEEMKFAKSLTSVSAIKIVITALIICVIVFTIALKNLLNIFFYG